MSNEADVFDTLVVGAGPAGLSAAAAAAEGGARVLLVDDNPDIGGQYFRARDAGLTGRMQTMVVAELDAWRQRLASAKVQVETATALWGFGADDVAYLHSRPGNSISTVGFTTLVSAIGARELVRPFPGWTLPGVMTLGGCQSLMKSQGILPGKRIALAGSGPFLWLVASQMIEAGAHIVVVAEAAGRARIAGLGLASARVPALLAEGASFWQRIMRKAERVRFGACVVSAEGEHELKQVRIARLDRQGRPVAGSGESFDVDVLCSANGLVPNTDITMLAGCAHEYSAASGGPVALVDDFMETSKPGIFAAGETTGIGGADIAIEEGRRAAHGALNRLGKPGHARAITASATARRRQRVVDRFSEFCASPGDFCGLADEDTIICRCEEVSLKDIWQAVSLGDNQPEAVKTRTRCGMGMCQGRICGPTLARFVSSETGVPLGNLKSLTVRAPIRPVPIGALVGAPKRRGSQGAG
jgi:NADPH-dependent 2,4-dienoyl-CoA reductase/sulfur reductase-like enzyme